MSVAIRVDDDLARRLEARAEQHRMSLEQFAVAILDDAIRPQQSDPEWGPRNQRRLDLIRTGLKRDLSPAEQSELNGLQSWLDERFESFDIGLDRHLDDMKRAVELESGQSPHE